MKHLVILSGAGMSAESGISTFRDSNGLWEQYDVMKVASIEGWYEDPDLIQQFYNERRAQLTTVEPNAGHTIIAGLEKDFQVSVITQNVDNLHERAGSTHVIHLHGELTKACNESKTQVYEIGTRPVRPGEKAEDGSRLRPFIVWFGEAVPLIEQAAKIVSKADIVVIIGTSMQVYPAAGLIHYAQPDIPVFLIDPNEVQAPYNVEIIQEKAGKGMAILREKLKKLHLSFVILFFLFFLNIPIHAQEKTSDYDLFQAVEQEDTITAKESIETINLCDSLENVYNAKDSLVFIHKETIPQFPGGDKELMKFLVEHIQWPKECAEMAIQGRVVIRFVVSKTGKIICPKVIRSLHPALDQEALRVIDLMPDWIPETINDVPIDSWYMLPMLFRLQN